MKKIIIIAAVILVALGIYLSSSDSTQMVDEAGNPVEAKSVGAKIKDTFQQIIPGSDSTKKTLDESPHVVVINSNPVHIEVDDAIEKIEAQKDLKDNEAIDFARWTLFSDNAKYTAEEKENLLESSIEILKPEEAGMITRDVLLVGKMPGLIDVAMSYQHQHLKREEFENLIREVLKRRAEPEIRSAVIEFAATKNIYVK